MKNRWIMVVLLLLNFAGQSLIASEPTQKDSITRHEKQERFQRFLSSRVPLNPATGRILIPEHIKHIKIDIGLSYNAPMSRYWLSYEDDLVVFGFEPYIESVRSVRQLATTQGKHWDKVLQPLSKKYLREHFFIIPCALGTSSEWLVDFYVTKKDCGCSSIYEPTTFEIAKKIQVPIVSLEDFFQFFPFETHPVIEYIKVDAQGSDLDIIKSAGDYLKDHVIYVTIEPENDEYKNTHNSAIEIEEYMIHMGFTRYRSGFTTDPTYLNTRFLEYLQTHEVKIYQHG